METIPNDVLIAIVSALCAFIFLLFSIIFYLIKAQVDSIKIKIHDNESSVQAVDEKLDSHIIDFHTVK